MYIIGQFLNQRPHFARWILRNRRRPARYKCAADSASLDGEARHLFRNCINLVISIFFLFDFFFLFFFLLDFIWYSNFSLTSSGLRIRFRLIDHTTSCPAHLEARSYFRAIVGFTGACDTSRPCVRPSHARGFYTYVWKKKRARVFLDIRDRLI